MPLNPISYMAEFSVKSNSHPEPLLIRNEPTPPAIPTIPVIVAIAFLGNISPIVEKILADHNWCAAPAIPIITTGIRNETYPSGCAKSAKSGKNQHFFYELMLKWTFWDY